MPHARFTAYMKQMPQPYFEMEESRSVTPWVNRLYFEWPRASSFLGLWLVKTRHKNLVPLLSGVKPGPMVGSGRYVEPIPVKSPITGRHCIVQGINDVPDSKVHGANMGPIWGRQDPGGPHVGPMNFAICGVKLKIYLKSYCSEIQHRFIPAVHIQHTILS